jgi:pyruvate formate lyase activating enzyme
LTSAQREYITTATATAAGETSRQIGLSLGKSASYVRHVRAKLARGAAHDLRTSGVLIARDYVRFPHERGDGIPASIALDESLATLLGFYCAEGSVVRNRKRPNSYTLNFSFSHREIERANEVLALLKHCFNVEASFVWRSTTLAVCSGRTSVALLFKSLAGAGAAKKYVPHQLLHAPRAVVESFVAAYVAGDGHQYPNGKVSITTVSPELAHGVAFLALKLGYLPSVYEAELSPHCVIQGRKVARRPRQYVIVWYQNNESQPDVQRRLVQTREFHLIPLRRITSEDYDGDVFNMQIAHEHNYLANFLLVANCQNWVTSQMLRDVEAVAPPKLTTPTQLVDLAIQHGAPVVASSYNEPLITSEWAVAVFKEARARGLKCAYISNGNGTPQVLDFLRPHVEAYKVDLKTFNPKHYRDLGGVMENVTDTIRNLKVRNFWVEIVTLVVPGFSDDPDDLKRMADFLASVDPLMPWHITAFHPDYKMTDGYRQTTADDLLRIVEFGQQAGLQYIYPGNLPGQVGELENTRCHHCHNTVIERYGFLVRKNRVLPDGACPDCGTQIPGIWGNSSGHGDGRVRPLA